MKTGRKETRLRDLLLRMSEGNGRIRGNDKCHLNNERREKRREIIG